MFIQIDMSTQKILKKLYIFAVNMFTDITTSGRFIHQYEGSTSYLFVFPQLPRNNINN